MDDVRFANMASRTENLDALYAIVAEIISTRTTDEWLVLLDKADIPVARIETVESLMTHPHLVRSGFFARVDHPTEGVIVSMPKTSRWSVTQPEPTRPTPRLGEHSREILREAGFGDEEIEHLFVTGAVKGAAQ